jgi:hypothetical protein
VIRGDTDFVSDEQLRSKLDQFDILSEDGRPDPFYVFTWHVSDRVFVVEKS